MPAPIMPKAVAASAHVRSLSVVVGTGRAVSGSISSARGRGRRRRSRATACAGGAAARRAPRFADPPPRPGLGRRRRLVHLPAGIARPDDGPSGRRPADGRERAVHADRHDDVEAGDEAERPRIGTADRCCSFEHALGYGLHVDGSSRRVVLR